MSSFFSHGVKVHLGSNNLWLKLSALIDWQRITPLLHGVHSDFGPQGYDVLRMFKAIFLAHWHGLSDPALEESLRVRLDFLEFTGFALGDDLPDETTFCRFRGKLISTGKLPLLLDEMNLQLADRGLKLSAAATAIVDATLITAAARPRKQIEADEAGEYPASQSADSDARWLKKGAKSYFGYQGFARCDAEGFIDKIHVTPANLPETKELKTMADGLKKGTRLMADKGFASAANTAMLQEKNIKCGVMKKAARGRPLTSREKLFNKLISKTRFRIEQCFGTLKRKFLFTRTRYFGTAKVNAEMTLKAMCMNLLKAVNKVEFA